MHATEVYSLKGTDGMGLYIYNVVYQILPTPYVAAQKGWFLKWNAVLIINLCSLVFGL
jgi:hypothetical protein